MWTVLTSFSTFLAPFPEQVYLGMEQVYLGMAILLDPFRSFNFLIAFSTL